MLGGASSLLLDMEQWVESLLLLSIVMMVVTGIFLMGYHFGIRETQRVQLMHVSFMSNRQGGFPTTGHRQV